MRRLTKTLTKSGDIGVLRWRLEFDVRFPRIPRCALGSEVALFVAYALSPASDYRGHVQVGSLTGAVHLSNDNAGVPRPAQRERKSRVEQKGLCWLDPDFQYKYGR